MSGPLSLQAMSVCAIMVEMIKCKEVITVRDTYRYTGRGRTGFEMHYKARHYKLAAGEGGYCWKHRKVVDEK